MPAAQPLSSFVVIWNGGGPIATSNVKTRGVVSPLYVTARSKEAARGHGKSLAIVNVSGVAFDAVLDTAMSGYAVADGWVIVMPIVRLVSVADTARAASTP